jgi:hypothetical protein
MSSVHKILAPAAMLAVLVAAGTAQAYTVPPFSAPGINNPGYPDFTFGVLQANLWDAQFENVGSKNSPVWELTINSGAQNVGVFNFQSGAYTVGSETISLTAYFNNKGQLITSDPNALKITGSLYPSGCLPTTASPNTPTACGYGSRPTGVTWASVKNQTLWSASLTSFGVNTANDALGFNTSNFGGWADQSQFTGGSTSESLWLYALINTGNTYCVAPRPGNNCNNAPSQNGTFPYSTSNSAWNTFLKDLASGKGLSAATFYGIGGIATVPIPGALLLLGSGLAGLGGMLRRRREKALEA